MATRHSSHSLFKWLAAGAGVAVGTYAAMVGTNWLRYGTAGRRPAADGADALLDRFMPAYDVVERHHVRVDAPAEVTLQSAADMDLHASPIVRAIFRTRELVMGARAERRLPRPFLKEMRDIGWGVLAEIPGRQVVMGAVTQPWQANVVFRPLAPAEFRTFQEPGFVKIIWTLRAEPIGEHASVFRTETRAVPTDAFARAKFRRYWSWVSPGIVAIRWLLLRPVKLEAERRAPAAAETPSTPTAA
jgi:hypothetical protein